MASSDAGPTQAAELMQGLAIKPGYMVVDQLPDELKWKEAKSDAYRANVGDVKLEAIHKRYSGVDRPKITMLPGKGDRLIATPKDAMVVIRIYGGKVGIFGQLYPTAPKKRESPAEQTGSRKAPRAAMDTHMTTDEGSVEPAEPVDTAMAGEEGEEGEVFEQARPDSMAVDAEVATVTVTDPKAAAIAVHDKVEPVQKKRNLVKVAYALDSQMPAIQFEIQDQKPDSDRVIYTIFANMLEQESDSKSGIGLDFFAQAHKDTADDDNAAQLPDHAVLKRLHKDQRQNSPDILPFLRDCQRRKTAQSSSPSSTVLPSQVSKMSLLSDFSTSIFSCLCSNI